MTTLDKNSQSKQKSVSIVLIETNGTIKTLKTKEVTEETLHKKCGFRINDDFLPRHTWRVTLKENNEKNSIPYTVCVWAKKTGKANFENKYDFPPPIDNDLFFGTCAIVRMAEPADATSPGDFLDLTKETWLKIYEKLFGGFEDIGDEDEYSEDELENVDPALLTSHGYLKDDFVVSDKEAIELDSEESDTAVTVSASKAAPKAKAKAKLKQEAEATSVVVKQPLKKSMKIKGQSKPQKKGEEDEGEGEASINKGEASINPKTKSKGKGKGKPKVKENVNEHDTDDKEETDTSELEEEVYTFSDDD